MSSNQSNSLLPTKIIVTKAFAKELKALKKRYKQVDSDLKDLLKEIQQGHLSGDRIQGHGDKYVYKVRLRNTSANRGKSGGFRVIYYVVDVTNVYLMSIYSKSDKPDIKPEQIVQLIKDIGIG